MKGKILIAACMAALLLGGCIAGSSNTKAKPAENKNITKQFADLNGDGKKEIVETENKFDTESISVITAKRQLKNKETEKIDSFSVSGKIRKLEFIELYADGRKQIAATFDGKDNVANIAIYDLKNAKFNQVFVAASKYGIDAEFTSIMPRIKIGKAARGGDNSPNRVPDWDVWVWTGDKFIRD